MSGKPGKSGGARKGAGRHPSTLGLKDGGKILVFEKYQGKPVSRSSGGAFEVGVVAIERRGEFRIVLPDGTEFFFKLG
jgi:hypothetical protein